MCTPECHQYQSSFSEEMGLTLAISAGTALTGAIIWGIGHDRISRSKRMRGSFQVSPIVAPVPGGLIGGLQLIHF